MKVTVVDYGAGNLFSVQRALAVSGADCVVISSSPEDILNADRVILPGVGAFADGMRGLEENSLVSPLIEYAASGRPLLGICLGMQMLTSISEEFGEHQGLNLIPGRVVKIPELRPDNLTRKIPFIGWAELQHSLATKSAGSILSAMTANSSIYLVHSFHVQPERADNLLATYDFEGYAVTAAIRKENITGLQFHPEKSGKSGLAILRKFIVNPE